jgi:NADPH:quinone reductase-like Zn-dependent oxidoreductase
MRAMQLYSSPSLSPAGPTLRAAQMSQPTPAKNEVLIQVHAAGVTTTEPGWYPSTHGKNGEARPNAVPAHEFSGVIAALGVAVDGLAVGQQVYGMNDWFAEGALAEFCLTQPQSIAPKPSTLTHEEAATVPIGALTAWQGLIDRAKLQPSERVLVHGGAGAVGIFAIQLARLHKAYVISTASTSTLSFVSQLGADEVIDYKKSRFEDLVRDVDVVFDTVGGETRELSWRVLKPNGRMVTIAADAESSTDPRVKESTFIVEPNRQQLVDVAALFDAGSLRTFVRATVPLEQADSVYAQSIPQALGYGKTVVTVLQS